MQILAISKGGLAACRGRHWGGRSLVSGGMPGRAAHDPAAEGWQAADAGGTESCGKVRLHRALPWPGKCSTGLCLSIGSVNDPCSFMLSLRALADMPALLLLDRVEGYAVQGVATAGFGKSRLQQN